MLRRNSSVRKQIRPAGTPASKVIRRAVMGTWKAFRNSTYQCTSKAAILFNGNRHQLQA
jgi:hypothetical protein